MRKFKRQLSLMILLSMLLSTFQPLIVIAIGDDAYQAESLDVNSSKNEDLNSTHNELKEANVSVDEFQLTPATVNSEESEDGSGELQVGNGDDNYQDGIVGDSEESTSEEQKVPAEEAILEEVPVKLPEEEIKVEPEDITDRILQKEIIVETKDEEENWEEVREKPIKVNIGDELKIHIPFSIEGDRTKTVSGDFFDLDLDTSHLKIDEDTLVLIGKQNDGEVEVGDITTKETLKYLTEDKNLTSFALIGRVGSYINDTTVEEASTTLKVELNENINQIEDLSNLEISLEADVNKEISESEEIKFGTEKLPNIVTENVVLDDEDYTLSLKGAENTTIKAGETLFFLDAVTVETTGIGPEDIEYRVIVKDVETPEGGSYTWTEGDTGLSVTNEDNGKVYKVTYAIQQRSYDEENWTTEDGWETVKDSERVREITVEGLESEEVDLEIKGIGDLILKVGDKVEFLRNVSVEAVGEVPEGKQYRPIVLNVVTPQGGSYTWKDGDTEFTTAAQDNGKIYEIIYGVESSTDGGETWKVIDYIQETRKISVVDKIEIKDEITTDDMRVSNLTATVIDGTPNWDGDDKPGNDSGPSNGVVRTFDTVTYDLTYTTQSKTSTIYKHGRLYFEAELPVTEEKATFDTEAMGLMDTTPGYHWELEKTADGGQILKWYYELNTTTNEDGPVYPFPNTGTFPVIVKVFAMENGDTLSPKFRTSVAYTENGEIKTSGDYDVPQKYVGKDVKISAAPNYNIQLKKTSDSFVGAISTFDFSTGDDTAINKDAGNVYGRLQGYGLTVQLRNPSKDDGLKGIELPKGDITFDIDVSSVFKGSSGKEYPADSPLVWAYGKHNQRNALNGRDIAKYALDYLPGASPLDGSRTDSFQKNKIKEQSTNTWNGGGWTVTQSGSKLSVTVKDYIVNPFWFPSGDPGGGGTQYNYYNYEKELVQNIGCISGGALYLVMPFGGDSGPDNLEFYPNKYGESSGSLQTVVEDNNLVMTSVTDQKFINDQQVNKADDKIATSVSVSVGGGYDKFVYYMKSGLTSAVGMDGITEGPDWKSGTDSQMIGGDVGIGTRMINQAVGDENNSMLGYNGLLKFDNTALEFDNDKGFVIYTGELQGYESIKHLFAAKPDGTGWKDDAEMNASNEEDLVYYGTLAELEAAGKICVGILTEVRMPKDYQNFKQQVLPVYTNFKLKDDTAIAGKTYMITSVDNVWRKLDYNKVLEENGGQFPSRLDIPQGEVIPHKSVANFKQNYAKGFYDETGYNPGTGGEPKWGDTLYVVPYKATITKNIEQKDGGGQEKLNYDLSNGQRVADFALHPKLELLDTGESKFETTVTIKDTIPKGMLYTHGSSIFGGTYTPNANPGLSGTITGGENIEPAITNDADGNQILTWTIENQKITDEIPVIHYKASIDLATPANTTYVNTATISTMEDNRVIKGENGNLATAKLTVNAPATLVVRKTPLKQYNDIKEEIGYDLEWTNNGSVAYDKKIFMDTMPKSDDSRGSKFNGDYTVNGLKITIPTGKTNSDYDFYYTKAPAASEMISKDFKYEDFTDNTVTSNGVTWTKADIGTDGTVSEIVGKTPTAWVIVGDLDKQQSLKVNLKILPKENKSLDIYVNSMSVDDVEAIARITILDRRVSGTVWIDANNDGRKDGNELRVTDVNVSLMQNNGLLRSWIPAKDVNGDKYPTIQTDSMGRYEFRELPAGEFKVVFTSSDSVKLGEYKVTDTKKPGIEEHLNSDAKGINDDNGLLESAEITGITMPKAEDIERPLFELNNLDMGLTASVNFKGEKIWEDSDNQDGKRPESIEITLYKNVGGKIDEVETKTVTEKDGWKWSFDKLPRYENSTEIKYSIKEVTIPGYTTTYPENNVNNKYDPLKTSIHIAKSWDDANNQDGKRPESIEVQLLADGKPYEGEKPGEDTVVLNAGNNWSHEWIKLPQKKAGEEIKYTVKEISTPDGYDKPIIHEPTKGFIVIVNKHTPEITSVAGTKTWDDNNNQDKKRPTEIKITLLADGEIVYTKTVTETDGWKWNFENLPKYKDGAEVAYTITEEVVKDYTSTVNGSDVTNTYTPNKTQVNVLKSWDDKNDYDGIRPTSIEVVLYKTVDGVKTLVDRQTLNEANNWKHTWNNLPEKEEGKDIVYTVEESGVPSGYVTTQKEVSNGNIVITNTHIPETPWVPGEPTDPPTNPTPEIDIEGEKTWTDENNLEGKRPSSIAVNLYANNKLIATKTVRADSNGNWKYKFTDLPKREGGKDINYSIGEVVPEYYSASYSGYNIHNKYTPEETSFTVRKVWDDENDVDKIRPENISVQLYANGEKYGEEIVLNDSNSWTYSWTNLSKIIDGEKIKYTVKEIEVPDSYEVSYDESASGNVTITNKHIPVESVIMTESNEPTKVEKTGKVKLPKTGIVGMTALTISGISIIGLGMYLLKKKDD